MEPATLLGVPKAQHRRSTSRSVLMKDVAAEIEMIAQHRNNTHDDDHRASIGSPARSSASEGTVALLSKANSVATVAISGKTAAPTASNTSPFDSLSVTVNSQAPAAAVATHRNSQSKRRVSVSMMKLISRRSSSKAVSSLKTSFEQMTYEELVKMRATHLTNAEVQAAVKVYFEYSPVFFPTFYRRVTNMLTSLGVSPLPTEEELKDELAQVGFTRNSMAAMSFFQWQLLLDHLKDKCSRMKDDEELSLQTAFAPPTDLLGDDTTTSPSNFAADDVLTKGMSFYMKNSVRDELLNSKPAVVKPDENRSVYSELPRRKSRFALFGTRELRVSDLCDALTDMTCINGLGHHLSLASMRREDGDDDDEEEEQMPSDSDDDEESSLILSSPKASVTPPLFDPAKKGNSPGTKNSPRHAHHHHHHGTHGKSPGGHHTAATTSQKEQTEAALRKNHKAIRNLQRRKYRKLFVSTEDVREVFFVDHHALLCSFVELGAQDPDYRGAFTIQQMIAGVAHDHFLGAEWYHALEVSVDQLYNCVLFEIPAELRLPKVNPPSGSAGAPVRHIVTFDEAGDGEDDTTVPEGYLDYLRLKNRYSTLFLDYLAEGDEAKAQLKRGNDSTVHPSSRTSPILPESPSSSPRGGFMKSPDVGTTPKANNNGVSVLKPLPPHVDFEEFSQLVVLHQLDVRHHTERGIPLKWEVPPAHLMTDAHLYGFQAQRQSDHSSGGFDDAATIDFGIPVVLPAAVAAATGALHKQSTVDDFDNAHAATQQSQPSAFKAPGSVLEAPDWGSNTFALKRQSTAEGLLRPATGGTGRRPYGATQMNTMATSRRLSVSSTGTSDAEKLADRVSKIEGPARHCLAEMEAELQYLARLLDERSSHYHNSPLRRRYAEVKSRYLQTKTDDSVDEKSNNRPAPLAIADRPLPRPPGSANQPFVVGSLHTHLSSKEIILKELPMPKVPRVHSASKRSVEELAKHTPTRFSFENASKRSLLCSEDRDASVSTTRQVDGGSTAPSVSKRPATGGSTRSSAPFTSGVPNNKIRLGYVDNVKAAPINSVLDAIHCHSKTSSPRKAPAPLMIRAPQPPPTEKFSNSPNTPTAKGGSDISAGSTDAAVATKRRPLSSSVRVPPPPPSSGDIESDAFHRTVMASYRSVFQIV